MNKLRRIVRLGMRQIEIIDAAIDMDADISSQLAEMSADPARQVAQRLAAWSDLAWDVYADRQIPHAGKRPSAYLIAPDGQFVPDIDGLKIKVGWGHAFASEMPALLGLDADGELELASLVIRFAHVVNDRLTALASVQRELESVGREAGHSMDGRQIMDVAIGLAASVMQAESAAAALLHYRGVHPATATRQHPEGQTADHALTALYKTVHRFDDATKTNQTIAAARHAALRPFAREVEADRGYLPVRSRAEYVLKRYKAAGCPRWPGGQLLSIGRLRNIWDQLIAPP